MLQIGDIVKTKKNEMVNQEYSNKLALIVDVNDDDEDNLLYSLYFLCDKISVSWFEECDLIFIDNSLKKYLK